jgi:6-phosphofructokinase 1
MAKKSAKVIGILTGGGDVPGLNPAIRAVTVRALREGYQVVGIRRGWGGLVDVIRDKNHDNSNNFQILTEDIVNRAGRTGGTFLHTSRTNPAKVKKDSVPEYLKDKYTEERNDLTEEVLKNLDFLGIDYMIPIGGDDTLSMVYVCIRRGSGWWPYQRRWIMMSPARIIASALAPV